ncbi:MAG TPA: hypothetical protein VNT26_04645 [Candidatus Sulfotelmatobacter sp.]|nr:hypothetical protein [Candidatus Sulfotelmatobacter sp.]
MRNKEQAKSVKDLTPLEAVEAWLDGKAGTEEEEALLQAIHKDDLITLTDEEILESVFEAMEQGLNPEQCLERLEAGV